MSSVVELHIYGVCDTAVLHDVHSPCTCIHLHLHPLQTYITYRLHKEVRVLPHARPRRQQKCPAASRDDAMTRLRVRVRVRVWAAGRMARPESDGCDRNRVADGGVSSQNRVYPFQIRPKSGLGGRSPIRWRPGTNVEGGTRFWSSGFRVYPILAIAHIFIHDQGTIPATRHCINQVRFFMHV